MFIQANTTFQGEFLNYLTHLTNLINHPPANMDPTLLPKFVNGAAVMRAELIALHKDLKTQASVAKQNRLGIVGLQARADHLLPDVHNASHAAAQFCQNVRHAGTPAAWNAGYQAAARNITQNIGNVDTFIKRGAKLTIKGKQPNDLVVALTPFAQAHKPLPNTATKADVEHMVGELEALLKLVDSWVAQNQ